MYLLFSLFSAERGGSHMIFSSNTIRAQRDVGRLQKYLDFSEYLSLDERKFYTWGV